MTLPEATPPPVMAAELAAFCARARSDGSGLYGQLLRENVGDALRSSFPLFVDRLGLDALDEAAGTFVVEHPAVRPQFHSIATEFVAFAQTRLRLSPALTALLEYEWMLLAAEIDPAHVQAGGRSDARVALNPTVRLVLLPFDLAQDGWASAQGDDTQRPYAIFRSSDHMVRTLPLTHQACLLVEHVRDAEAILPATLARLTAALVSERDILAWVMQELASGLLYPPPEAFGEDS
jgi:uncharacterized protein